MEAVLTCRSALLAGIRCWVCSTAFCWQVPSTSTWLSVAVVRGPHSLQDVTNKHLPYTVNWQACIHTALIMTHVMSNLFPVKELLQTTVSKLGLKNHKNWLLKQTALVCVLNFVLTKSRHSQLCCYINMQSVKHVVSYKCWYTVRSVSTKVVTYTTY